MKVAVLISGELRTFDQCKKTWEFLNDSQVTVFVSTWLDTHYDNKILKIKQSHTKTEADIRAILGDVKIGGILVEEFNPFDRHAKYNSNMIYRMYRGIELIEDDFDFVIVIRPDIFFHNSSSALDMFAVNGNDMKFLMAMELANGRLQDVMFSGTLNTLRGLLNANTLAKWNHSDNDDWHTWFYQHMCQANLIPVEMDFSWGRPNMGINPTYRDVVNAQNVWRDSIIARQFTELGVEKTTELWGGEMVLNVKKMLLSGFFLKYALMHQKGPRDAQRIEQ